MGDRGDVHEWVGDLYFRLFDVARPGPELERPASRAAVEGTLAGVRHLRAPGPASAEDLWDLYAVHRVDALLRTAFEPRRSPDEPGQHRGRCGHLELDVEEYARYWTGVGMRTVTASAFHPFFHEIVDVEAADDPDAPCTLIATVWPCLLWGRLLFGRAGVRVRAGANVIDGAVACSSKLYWSHLRLDRSCEDLSTGWGSNSQWRTAFRRDYVDDGRLRYNVDAVDSATRALGHDWGDPARRAELLRYRCCVVPPVLDDIWPWDLAADEPVPADLELTGLEP